MKERVASRHQENPYPPQFAPLAEDLNAAFRKVGLKELPAAEIAQNLWRPPLGLEKAIEVEMSRYGPALTAGLKNNLLFLGHPPLKSQEQAKITVARRYPEYLLHLQSFPPGWFSTNQIIIEDIHKYNDRLILARLVLLKTGQITWQSEEKLSLGPKYGLLIVSPAVFAIGNPIVLNLMNLPANLGSIFGKDGKIQIIPSLRDTSLEAMKERFTKEYPPPAPPRPKPKPPTTPVSFKASAEPPVTPPPGQLKFKSSAERHAAGNRRLEAKQKARQGKGGGKKRH